MKDHQLGYTLPLQPLGAKIERHQATPEDRRAIELCKFEQKRHDLMRRFEQDAFHDWLYSVYPSGDVDEVQRKWLESYERECWLDEQEDA